MNYYSNICGSCWQQKKFCQECNSWEIGDEPSNDLEPSAEHFNKTKEIPGNFVSDPIDEDKDENKEPSNDLDPSAEYFNKTNEIPGTSPVSDPIVEDEDKGGNKEHSNDLDPSAEHFNKNNQPPEPTNCSSFRVHDRWKVIMGSHVPEVILSELLSDSTDPVDKEIILIMLQCNLEDQYEQSKKKLGLSVPELRSKFNKINLEIDEIISKY